MNREVNFKLIKKNNEVLFELQIGGTKVLMNQKEAQMLSVIMDDKSFDIFGVPF